MPALPLPRYRVHACTRQRAVRTACPHIPLVGRSGGLVDAGLGSSGGGCCRFVVRDDGVLSAINLVWDIVMRYFNYISYSGHLPVLAFIRGRRHNPLY